LPMYPKKENKMKNNLRNYKKYALLAGLLLSKSYCPVTPTARRKPESKGTPANLTKTLMTAPGQKAPVPVPVQQQAKPEQLPVVVQPALMKQPSFILKSNAELAKMSIIELNIELQSVMKAVSKLDVLLGEAKQSANETEKITEKIKILSPLIDIEKQYTDTLDYVKRIEEIMRGRKSEITTQAIKSAIAVNEKALEDTQQNKKIIEKNLKNIPEAFHKSAEYRAFKRNEAQIDADIEFFKSELEWMKADLVEKEAEEKQAASKQNISAQGTVVKTEAKSVIPLLVSNSPVLQQPVQQNQPVQQQSVSVSKQLPLAFKEYIKKYKDDALTKTLTVWRKNKEGEKNLGIIKIIKIGDIAPDAKVKTGMWYDTKNDVLKYNNDLGKGEWVLSIGTLDEIIITAEQPRT
jgi:hypothetical protein